MDSILFITRITEPYSVLYLYLSNPVLAAYLLAARIRCPLTYQLRSTLQTRRGMKTRDVLFEEQEWSRDKQTCKTTQ